jgi:hypothetical protein
MKPKHWIGARAFPQDGNPRFCYEIIRKNSNNVKIKDIFSLNEEN